MYWKWMWSMMRRPGERRMEIAAAWAARLFFVVDSMNLRGVRSWLYGYERVTGE